MRKIIVKIFAQYAIAYYFYTIINNKNDDNERTNN